MHGFWMGIEHGSRLGRWEDNGEWMNKQPSRPCILFIYGLPKNWRSCEFNFNMGLEVIQKTWPGTTFQNCGTCNTKYVLEIARVVAHGTWIVVIP